MNNIVFPLSHNTIDKNDIYSLCDWLRTMPRLSMAELTIEAEKECAFWTGRKYSVFVNSGSSANLLAAYVAKICGRLKNNKVVVPSIRLGDNDRSIYPVWI